MDEDQALRKVDEELEAALCGIAAPSHFSASVMRRAREPKLTYWPDVLDSIGIFSILAAVFALLIWLVPDRRNSYWALVLASALVIPALCFGLGSVRELGD